MCLSTSPVIFLFLNSILDIKTQLISIFEDMKSSDRHTKVRLEIDEVRYKHSEQEFWDPYPCGVEKPLQ